MQPVNDVVVSLLETPFNRRSDTNKRQIISEERPTPALTVLQSENRNRKTRTFQLSWYQSYKWLCGSIYKQRLFCWPCLLLGITKNVWSSDGYIDFKNISRSTKMHLMSKDHIKNFVNFKRLQNNTATIADALQESAALSKVLYNEDVRLNRLLMTNLIDVTLLLSKQELAFRGHDETSESLNRGNFREVFTLLIKRNEELSKQLEKHANIFSGQSKTIQNELICCINEYVLDYIKNEVKDVNFIGVIVDDTTDIVEKSQCAITIRYVTKNGDLRERFLGFHNVSSNRSASALFELVTTVLEPYDYKEKLIAQSYDGASVMAGEINGLKTKIKSVAPFAIFTHCCAHRLNLVLQQGTKCIPQSRIFFSSVTGIPTYFNHSAKRTFILDSVVGKRIPTANETRWYTRSKILMFISNEWEKLKVVFDNIVNDENSGDESIRGAKGFLKYFENFEFAFLTTLYNNIFGITDVLFQILQKKSLDIKYCSAQIQVTYNLIAKIRSAEKIREFFNVAKNLAPPDLTHRRAKNITEIDFFNTYKVLAYEIIDTILLQITTRFSDFESSLKFLPLVDSSKYNDYAKKSPNNELRSLEVTYPEKFNLELLKNELCFVYADEQFKNKGVEETIKLLVNSDMCEVMPEVFKLFSLVLTIPATSVSVERNFSCLKRIKTYLRNAISQDRLSALSTLSIEKELLHELSKSGEFYDNIISNFALLKDRRINLIFKK